MLVQIEVPDEEIRQMLRTVFKIPKSKLDLILNDQEFQELFATDLLECWRGLNEIDRYLSDAVESSFADCLIRLGFKIRDE